MKQLSFADSSGIKATELLPAADIYWIGIIGIVTKDIKLKLV